MRKREGPFAGMTIRGAAERLLADKGPLTTSRIVVELRAGGISSLTGATPEASVRERLNSDDRFRRYGRYRYGLCGGPGTEKDRPQPRSSRDPDLARLWDRHRDQEEEIALRLGSMRHVAGKAPEDLSFLLGMAKDLLFSVHELANAVRTLRRDTEDLERQIQQSRKRHN